jgi:hypothetical protein
MRPKVKLLVGVVLLLALTFGSSAFGWLTRGDRVDGAVWGALGSQEYVDVLVVTRFKPELFHRDKLQAVGSLGAGATGTSIVVNHVSRRGVDEMATMYWIERVELRPLPAPKGKAAVFGAGSVEANPVPIGS